MAKIIIISGDLAAGKSVLAKRLSRHYQIPYFSKARFKEILGEKISFEGIDENKNISRSSYALLRHIGWRVAQVKGKVELLYLTGDLDVLFERFLYREHYENRHPVHLTHPLRSLEEFENYILKLRNEPEVLPRKMLDTTNCDQEMIFEKALKLIGSLD
jgi:RNase adaptor protein for sRNA GlmZ degradation